MNIEELSVQLENAVDNLFVLWLVYEEERIEHTTMSNALRAAYDHMSNISQAITGIIEKCPTTEDTE